jgi:putative membrane protein
MVTMVTVIIGSVFLALAAGIHIMIFVLESVIWSRPAVWRSFGLRSAQQAETVKPMAFNQGFYNLFLALGVIVGLVLLATSTAPQAGVAIMLASGTSMVLAALVLIVSSPKLTRAALIQGLAPLIGIALVAVGLLS